MQARAGSSYVTPADPEKFLNSREGFPELDPQGDPGDQSHPICTALLYYGHFF